MGLEEDLDEDEVGRLELLLQLIRAEGIENMGKEDDDELWVAKSDE